ncbi:MAG: DUF2706 domain-containing protein [Rickettsiaceae bacterium]
MGKLSLVTLFTISVITLSSCLYKPPYELKSPCVSIESSDEAISTCVKRPVNLNRDIV